MTLPWSSRTTTRTKTRFTRTLKVAGVSRAVTSAVFCEASGVFTEEGAGEVPGCCAEVAGDCARSEAAETMLRRNSKNTASEQRRRSGFANERGEWRMFSFSKNDGSKTMARKTIAERPRRGSAQEKARLPEAHTGITK